MNFEGLKVENTSLSGFSVLTENELLLKITTDPDFSALGDFVFSLHGKIKEEEITLIYSTELAAIPWYYSYTDQQFHHGSNVFDVWKKNGQTWQWNETALYAINNLDHSVGDHTIHKEIKRVPPNCTLIYFRNELTISKRVESLKSKSSAVTIDKAIYDFDIIMKDYLTDRNKNYFLSLSAGFDSRLLLAAMLKNEIRPFVATMGYNDSTDVKIAAAIAKDFGLRHENFTLHKNDYFDQQKINNIIRLTSGTKPMRHWHTFFFIEHFRNLENTLHFAGSNGELIRSYYFDKGIISKMLNFSGTFGFEMAIRAKLKRGDNVVIPSLKKEQNHNQVSDIFLNDAPDLAFMSRLAYSYSNQRVRHFTGKGLALYNHSLKTISPFLDKRFLEIKNALPQKFTLNNLFHKHCIHHLCPELMKYPNSENSTSINDYNSNTYFLKKPVFKDYNMAGVLIKEEAVRNIIFESRYLDQWLTNNDRQGIWNAQNERTISFLVTLHHTAALIQNMQ